MKFRGLPGNIFKNLPSGNMTKISLMQPEVINRRLNGRRDFDKMHCGRDTIKVIWMESLMDAFKSAMNIYIHLDSTILILSENMKSILEPCDLWMKIQ